MKKENRKETKERKKKKNETRKKQKKKTEEKRKRRRKWAGPLARRFRRGIPDPSLMSDI